MAQAHHACYTVCDAMLVDTCLFGLVTTLVFKRTNFCDISRQISNVETLFNFAFNDISFWLGLIAKLYFYSAVLAGSWNFGKLLLYKKKTRVLKE